MYRTSNILSAFKIYKVNLQERASRKAQSRWEDTIKMDLKEICFDTRNWIDLAQDGITGESL